MPSRAIHNEWLAGLDPVHRTHFTAFPAPPARWGHMGLVPPPPGTQAPHTMRADPVLAAALAEGSPPAADDHLNASIKAIYNQGQEGSCASFTTSAIVSINEFIERGQWVTYDGHMLYKEVGGVGNSGSSLEDNCNHAIKPGAPVLGNTGARDTFDSWAYAPTDSAANFVTALKTAISAGRPCMLAVMLPTGFGYSSSGAQTSGYHALTVTMYDATWVGGPNSWGAGWGQNGFYRFRWDYLTANNFQTHYCFAIVPIDIGAPTPPPPPPPPLTHLLSAELRDAAGTITTTGVLSL